MKESHIRKIRAFNRYYAAIIGLSNKSILNSRYSLPEARILYELGRHKTLTSGELIKRLHIDKGYLSRLLRQFERWKLVNKKRSPEDHRSYNLSLTTDGKKEFLALNKASDNQIKKMLLLLSDADCNRLTDDMTEIEALLNSVKPAPGISRKHFSADDVTVRTYLRPGDLGFIIHRHGAIYHDEYGYQLSFESYVAAGLDEFYRKYDSKRDRVWLCEYGGQIVGFMLMMHRQNNTAQLRFFYLEPAYRGMGVGKKLMRMFMNELKKCGYTSSYLWTTHQQTAAAALYIKHGFELSAQKRSTAFGISLIEQRYNLKLK